MESFSDFFSICIYFKKKILPFIANFSFFFQLFFALVIIYTTIAESRYPYEDTYSPGDIVPGLNGRATYGRESGYARRTGGYSGILSKKKNAAGYGKHRDDGLLNRDYRRRYKNHDHYLPPRGIGGAYNRHYERPDYGRQRPHISGPPRYYDEDEIDYGGYGRNNRGRGTRYN